MKPFVAGSLIALTTASLAGNALLYLRYSTSRPLVTVGNQVISKKQYQDALDYQTQGSVLKKLVLADLVNQAAAKAGVTPTDADVDARVADIQRRTPQALGDAANNPAKMAEIKDSLRTDLALDNLRIKDIRVTDAQISDAYKRHEKELALPIQVRTSMVVTENPVDAATASSLLKQGVGLDVIARQPRLHVSGMNGFQFPMQALMPDSSKKITNIVFRMKQGSVETVEGTVRTTTTPKTFYFVLKNNKNLPARVPPLAEIKPAVTRLAKLEKAPTVDVEIAKLYQSVPPQFNVAKYEDYFRDLSQRDITNSGKQTASLP